MVAQPDKRYGNRTILNWNGVTDTCSIMVHYNEKNLLKGSRIKREFARKKIIIAYFAFSFSNRPESPDSAFSLD